MNNEFFNDSTLEKLFIFYHGDFGYTVYSRFCNDYLAAFSYFLDYVFHPVLRSHTRKSYDRAVKKLFPSSCSDDYFTYSTYLKSLFDHSFTMVSNCFIESSLTVHLNNGRVSYDLLDESDSLYFHLSGLTTCFSFSVGSDDDTVTVTQIRPFASESVLFVSRMFDTFCDFMESHFQLLPYTSTDS